ncbi:MAG: T9SS type A sorting domain-containing protein [Bacteroidia bacterium]|nr:T9SS type A sorting domain-containing protein [Bacteroidia bacterium]
MKNIITFLLILIFSVNSLSQNVLFDDFENWNIPGVQGEVPVGWKTNNSGFQGNFFFPVAKSTDSYQGKFALRVQTAQGFEGPAPGLAAKTIPISAKYYNYNAIVFNIKCPQITRYGKVRIRVIERKLDMLNIAASWEDSIIVTDYKPITLYLKKMNSADSLSVTIMALNNNEGLQSVGTAEILVDNIEFTTILGLGSEVSSLSGLTLYPNPSQDVIHLKSDLVFQSYSIHSPTGAAIESGILSGETKSISVKNLEPGAYIIKLNQNGNTTTYKFIKL